MTCINGTALRASVILHPDDDTPRLVYADYLDETATAARCDQCQDGLVYRAPDRSLRCICTDHVVPNCPWHIELAMCAHPLYKCGVCGGTGLVASEASDLAEFIRATISLTKLRHDNDGETHRIRRLETGARLLLTRRWVAWTAHVPVATPGEDDFGLYAPPVFERGFITHVTCPYHDWVQAADKLVWDDDQKEPVIPGYEERAEYACDVCGNVPGEDGILEHGDGCYTQGEDGGGFEYVDLPSGERSRPCPDTAHPIRRVTLKTWPTWDFNLYGAALTGRTRRDQLRGGDHDRRSIAERLLEVEWPNIKFDLPEYQ